MNSGQEPAPGWYQNPQGPGLRYWDGTQWTDHYRDAPEQQTEPAAAQFTDPSAPRHHEHHVRTPTNELSHERKLARQRLHITVLSAVLVLVLLMLAYAAMFDLNSWAEWVVLGAICFAALGAMIAVNTRGD